MAFDASSLGGMGGGAGKTATSSAPTTISPVYGVSGGNVVFLVVGSLAALTVLGFLFYLFTGKSK